MIWILQSWNIKIWHSNEFFKDKDHLKTVYQINSNSLQAYTPKPLLNVLRDVNPLGKEYVQFFSDVHSKDYVVVTSTFESELVRGS